MDGGATTQMDFRVLDKMLPYQTQLFGNPHSRSHMFGWESEKAVEEARQNLADLIGASPKEIFFTSGATESNNIILKGMARFYGKKKNHIITTQIDHKCVLDTCRYLEDEGMEVTYLKVTPEGLVDLADLEKAIRPGKTLAVSIIGVHNELGVLQKLEEIGQLCKDNKVLFHTDGAQAVGKVPIDVNKMKIDAMSISGHKMYGPKGVGAMYIRRKPRVKLTPLISGGGQERGLRSGTLSPALCVGIGEAARICNFEMEGDTAHINKLSDRFVNEIFESIPMVHLNGHREQRFKGILNISFEYVEGESMIMALKNLAVSSGSACTSASLEPSYVLRGLGLGEELSHTSIRFSIGRFTTEKEIEFALETVKDRVKILRALSPFLSSDDEDMKVEWVGGKH